MWEKISNDDDPKHNFEMASYRLKVPGGWIVRSSIAGHGVGASVAQTFVADANHEWKLGE